MRQDGMQIPQTCEEPLCLTTGGRVSFSLKNQILYQINFLQNTFGFFSMLFSSVADLQLQGRLPSSVLTRQTNFWILDYQGSCGRG